MSRNGGTFRMNYWTIIKNYFPVNLFVLYLYNESVNVRVEDPSFIFGLEFSLFRV